MKHARLGSATSPSADRILGFRGPTFRLLDCLADSGQRRPVLVEVQSAMRTRIRLVPPAVGEPAQVPKYPQPPVTAWTPETRDGHEVDQQSDHPRSDKDFPLERHGPHLPFLPGEFVWVKPQIEPNPADREVGIKAQLIKPQAHSEATAGSHGCYPICLSSLAADRIKRSRLCCCGRVRVADRFAHGAPWYQGAHGDAIPN